MKLSIAVITFNRPQLLDELLESIRNSDLEIGRDAELLILNNGSTNETEELLASWRERLPFTLLNNNKNLRGHRPFLQLLGHTKGEWVIFPGDDDRFISSAMHELLSACINANPNANVLAFGARVIDEDGKRTGRKFVPKKFENKNAFLASAIFHNPFWLPATLVRRSAIDIDNAPKSIVMFDWWLWIDLGVKGLIQSFSREIVEYRIHSNREQLSYLDDQWILDKLINSFNQIKEGSIRRYIEGLELEECKELLNRLSHEVNSMRLEQPEKLILVLLIQEVVLLHPYLKSLAKTVLMSAEVDLRLSATLLETDLTKEDFIKGILLNKSESQEELWANLKEMSQQEIENYFIQLSIEKRSSEAQFTLSPIERQFIFRLRRLKRNPLARGLIRHFLRFRA